MDGDDTVEEGLPPGRHQSCFFPRVPLIKDYFPVSLQLKADQDRTRTWVSMKLVWTNAWLVAMAIKGKPKRNLDKTIRKTVSSC